MNISHINSNIHKTIRILRFRTELVSGKEVCGSILTISCQLNSKSAWGLFFGVDIISNVYIY